MKFSRETAKKRFQLVMDRLIGKQRLEPFALLLGKSVGTINNWRTPGSVAPRPDELDNMLDKLGVPLELFYGDEDTWTNFYRQLRGASSPESPTTSPPRPLPPKEWEKPAWLFTTVQVWEALTQLDAPGRTIIVATPNPEYIIHHPTIQRCALECFAKFKRMIFVIPEDYIYMDQIELFRSLTPRTYPRPFSIFVCKKTSDNFLWGASRPFVIVTAIPANEYGKLGSFSSSTNAIHSGFELLYTIDDFIAPANIKAADGDHLWTAIPYRRFPSFNAFFGVIDREGREID